MRKLSSVILADLVTSKRKEKSMTQQSLAEATGINRALISRIEKQDFIAIMGRSGCGKTGFYPVHPAVRAAGRSARL